MPRSPGQGENSNWFVLMVCIQNEGKVLLWQYFNTIRGEEVL